MIQWLRSRLQKFQTRRGTVSSEGRPPTGSSSARAVPQSDSPSSTRTVETCIAPQATSRDGSEALNASDANLTRLLRGLGLGESAIRDVLRHATSDPVRKLLLDSLEDRRCRRHSGSSSSPIGGR